MDRMGVSGTLDIGSIPIRATYFIKKSRKIRDFWAVQSRFKRAKISSFLLLISKIRSNIAAPVWEFSFLAQLVRARDC